MVKPPISTILLVGNRFTGKTTYIHRLMGFAFEETQHENSDTDQDEISLHYIPVSDTDDDVIRIIVMNQYSDIPQEYNRLVEKVIVFASFDNDYSINDIVFHNIYAYLDVPIHIIINKKELIDNASEEIQNAVFRLIGSITSQGLFASVNLISCKIDGNIYLP